MITLPSPAKLNLFLHITGRRADGYHNLQTVFQLLDYGDELSFMPTTQAELRLTCNDPLLQSDNNLVVKAAHKLQDLSKTDVGCHIHLHKRLPIGGGLGGGSSNAATTLLALNQLWQCGLTLNELMPLGLQLGADVPLFLFGHSSWAEGIGEKLVKMTLPEQWFVVISPPCQVATAEIFKHMQLTRNSAPIRIPVFPFSGTKNDCEPVACLLNPLIKTALNWLGNFSEPHMSGTGSSVFARFNSRAQAMEVMTHIPSGFSGFVAQGINSSPLHASLYQRMAVEQH